ncbi:Arc family DNA-binding protein [Pseudomonas sp. P66]|uniref:Arc family DNA-binding protein n=1 Tax=Pseudomonas arcuscaelestis TaxID=2710591 RepID=A0ABS2BZY3_9PSED|nr:Arc family DNA-binding protein [Pseudomonas arcuscaelestis]MBM5458556.1 Arc family DNA-binding protein [Pseudomonas arcuscaelestis]
MIRSSSVTASPQTAFPAAPSRTAEKFVLRIPQALKEAVENVARGQFRSFNSEVALAVISHFEGHRRLITMRNLLVNRLGAKAGKEVLAQFERIDPDAGLNLNYNVRFPDGVRDELKESSNTSMRDMVANACADWVLYSTQIEGLLRRCEDPEIQFPPHGIKH